MADTNSIPPFKTCKKCGQTKPTTEFFKASGCKDGLRGGCKLCDLARQSKYCAENRDAISAQKKIAYDLTDPSVRREKRANYYKANSDAVKIRVKVWAKNNSAHIKQKSAENWAKNRDALLERSARYRDENRDKLLARRRERSATIEEKEKRAAYTEKNSKKIKESQSARHAANKVKANQKSRDYRVANPEKVKAAAIKWHTENPDASRAYHHNRRARKIAAGGKLTKGLLEKLFILQKGMCPCCSQPLGDNYHMDHIVPLALGGANIDSNIQLLRQRCNNQKYASHPIDFMQSRGFLL